MTSKAITATKPKQIRSPKQIRKWVMDVKNFLNNDGDVPYIYIYWTHEADLRPRSEEHLRENGHCKRENDTTSAWITGKIETTGMHTTR